MWSILDISYYRTSQLDGAFLFATNSRLVICIYRVFACAFQLCQHGPRRLIRYAGRRNMSQQEEVYHWPLFGVQLNFIFALPKIAMILGFLRHVLKIKDINSMLKAGITWVLIGRKCCKCFIWVTVRSSTRDHSAALDVSSCGPSKVLKDWCVTLLSDKFERDQSRIYAAESNQNLKMHEIQPHLERFPLCYFWDLDCSVNDIS